ncbi:hypothetical protein X734_13900 [Mesorhizobium sp. L2C084A000]|nr:hypothetical protein X734_13900 [Mesorhizobium sp. L2C084A000]
MHLEWDMVDIVSSEAGIPRPDHPLEQSGSAKWFLPAFGVRSVAPLQPEPFAAVVPATPDAICCLPGC